MRLFKVTYFDYNLHRYDNILVIAHSEKFVKIKFKEHMRNNGIKYGAYEITQLDALY